MIPDSFFVAAAFAYGLVFGSFGNVCIHRLPRDLSIVWPRSACPTCGRPIAWFDNLPVISWLLLLGRCRACRRPISPRYPFVELASGTIFGLAMARHPGQWGEAGAEALFGWALLVLIFSDFDLRILPDSITLGGAAAGLALSFARPSFGPIQSLIGVAAGGGILWAIAAIYSAVRHREGMGFGDIKMLALIGAFLGWKGVVVALVLGSLAGSIVGLVLLARGRSLRDSALPFGVFLGLASLAAIYVGPTLIAIYGF